MDSDVIVIGAGLSGLSAAALLSKRGLKVTVVEADNFPGGSCGIFKRKDAVFDQGSSMLYGFGQKGFNAHRFLFNCLEEPFEVIKHELLYTVFFKGEKVRFFSDINLFTEELSKIFPTRRSNIKRFYRDMTSMYEKVIAERPNYTTPDETDLSGALSGVLRHPVAYIKFLTYMNKSARWLLEKYFDDEEIFDFFDKLTSTYCYATLEEAPAIMASVMFADNHIGGSFYPAGSTLFLPGKLEKVIEQNGGKFFYNSACSEILTREGDAIGIKLESGEMMFAKDIIYSGTVWELYGNLLRDDAAAASEREKAQKFEATYPSVVLFALVNAEAIDESACPVEMLTGDPKKTDESEITVYIPSIDDKTLCPPDTHVLEAIGPSFRKWAEYGSELYGLQKQEETERILDKLETRFPEIRKHVVFSELATPHTIEHFTRKPNGAVAGPKQMIGQHMLLRQHTKTYMPSLFCCGESTVMGTGTPTVTVSGIAAANAVLKKRGLEPFVWKRGMKNFVIEIAPPFCGTPYSSFYTEAERELVKKASRCRYCLYPKCCGAKKPVLRDIMRRVSVGNFYGAKVLLSEADKKYTDKEFLKACEKRCVLNGEGKPPVEIEEIVNKL